MTVHQYDNQITEEEAAGLARAVDSFGRQQGKKEWIVRPDWTPPGATLEGLEEKLGELITRKVYETSAKAMELFANMVIVPETVILSRFEPRAHQLPHTDAEFEPVRAVSAVLFLNGGLQGGNVFFPALDVEVEPRRGLLLVYRSNVVHGMQRLEGGKLYTLRMWFREPR